jgi:hypothetical protein
MGWLGDKYIAFKNHKNGRNPDGSSKISEADLIKYTGHDKTSLDKWAANAPGVAGNQTAGAITAGGNSGLYSGGYTSFDAHHVADGKKK